ncbi:RNA ligase 1 family protein [Brevundimonas sp. Root1279]|uniref:RNA ligase 1 family protein n=1 Tax=Brevundimonas sp. Root1279 TaxID=1736443 RepID=UPI0006FDABA7|nr:DUF5565 family protein [Brevundimonas sp. Root1279]KQW84051.1 hypothetical protein ASC65_05390 [Brevundimonas sp. Root1279]
MKPLIFEPGEQDSKSLQLRDFKDMQKMKTVFVMDRTTHRATSEAYAQWVIDGEGRATIKHDGTSCLIEGGKLFKRFDAKKGRRPPDGWVPCEPAPDPKTGSWPGWVPVDMNDSASIWHAEAFEPGLADGTYELVGPKVQGNRYGLVRHQLWRHGCAEVEVGRTMEDMIAWLEANDHEGLVFHHPDGRMAKVRRKDFGLRW